MRIAVGNPYPLGATFDGAGTNFVVFTEAAHRVQLCLFDSTGHDPDGLPNTLDSAPMLQRLSRQAMAQLELQRQLWQALHGDDAAAEEPLHGQPRHAKSVQAVPYAVGARSMVILQRISH